MAYQSRYAAGPIGAAPMARTDGVLARRLFAYLIDLIVISGLVVLFGLIIGLLGIVTFGAAWLLYAILVPATLILYSALTVGGPAQGTIGMRIAGVTALDATTGGRVSPLLAGAHAFLFYVGVGTLLLLAIDIAIGLARSDRRLGHDLLTNLVFVRR